MLFSVGSVVLDGFVNGVLAANGDDGDAVSFYSLCMTHGFNVLFHADVRIE